LNLSSLLKQKPQYGANEASKPRFSLQEPRYVRITDIDEYGLLKNNIGVTAESIENQYILNDNDILFARSGATVGKTYIHKLDNTNYSCFFAGYMIRFVVDETKISPDYVFAYTQLKTYSKWVSSIQRAAGQPNINSEEYKSLKIPIPPQEIQDKIVAKMDDAYAAKKQKELEAQQLLDSIDDYLLGELGIELPEPEENTIKNRIFIRNLSEVSGDRFDCNYNHKINYILSQTGNYKIEYLKNLLIKPPQYGANEIAIDKNNSGEINYIRITDIDDLGFLKVRGLKTALKIEDKYILNQHDLLFARSGSVGRCYLHQDNKQKAIFAGYLIRFVLNTQIANPYYIFYYCHSKIYKMWVDAISRYAVQSNINSEEYKSLPIILPPLEKQIEISEHITAIRNQAKQLQQQAKDDLEKAKQEVEAMILGDD
jgi:restriction endonuclease S subunit